MRILLALALLVNLSAHPFLSTPASAEPIVKVTSVVGMHSGKCSPKRVAEVQTALESLSQREINSAHRCKCFHPSFQDVVLGERVHERGLPRQPKANVISIRLEPTASLARVLRLRYSVVAAAATVYPGQRATYVYFWEQPAFPTKRTYFQEFLFGGDPFHMNSPNHECG
jgi:hypothetical protein